MRLTTCWGIVYTIRKEKSWRLVNALEWSRLAKLKEVGTKLVLTVKLHHSALGYIGINTDFESTDQLETLVKSFEFYAVEKCELVD